MILKISDCRGSDVRKVKKMSNWKCATVVCSQMLDAIRSLSGMVILSS